MVNKGQSGGATGDSTSEAWESHEEHGETGPGGRLGRRELLMAAGASAVAGLAGCPTTITRTFSAPPLILPTSVLGRRDYSEETVESLTVERSGSKSGIDFEATIENHLAVYAPAQNSGSTSLAPMMGSFASPNASIQGTEVNPLATDSLRSIVTGEVLPQVRNAVLTRLSGLAGSDLSWIEGPTRVGTPDILQTADGDLTGELLGDEVTVEIYGGVAQGGDESYAVLLFLARQVGDNVGIVAGVTDRQLKDGTEQREAVGENGYFGPDRLAGGISAFLDLLPQFRFRTTTGTATPTPTATPSPAPTPTPTPATPTSGGSGRVIDDFEDGNRTEYRKLGLVNDSFVSSPTKHGSKALQFTNMYGSYGLASSGGLPNYPHQGDRFRAWFRLKKPITSGQVVAMQFGRDANGGQYSVGASKPPSGNVNVGIRGRNPVGSSNFTAGLSKGTWYAFDVAWGPKNFEFTLIDDTGKTLGSTTLAHNGDNGNDYIAFEASTGNNTVFWDYAHVVGGARSGYPLIIDDFEDGDTGEYYDTGQVDTSVVSSPTKHGSNALKFTNTTLYGIASEPGGRSSKRLPHYPHLGDQFRAWFRFEDTPSSYNGFTLEFGKDASGSRQSVWAEKRSNNWNAGINAVAGSSNSFTVSLSKGTWYAFDVSWGHTDIELDLLNASGASLGSTAIPSNGDNGEDFIKFKSDVNKGDTFLWDYAHILGHAR